MSFESHSDGLGIMRDAQTAKRQSFVTGGGWSVHNIIAVHFRSPMPLQGECSAPFTRRRRQSGCTSGVDGGSGATGLVDGLNSSHGRVDWPVGRAEGAASGTADTNATHGLPAAADWTDPRPWPAPPWQLER